MRVLLIEDKLLLGHGIQAALDQAGFAVDWVQDGDRADLALRTHRYHLVLLDLDLPGLPGWEVLKKLRDRGSEVPVLVLTRRDETKDRVRALDSGADDCVTKPFDIDELCARLRALHRRAAGSGQPLLQPAGQIVTVEGRRVSLSAREFAVLQTLLENAGRILSRQRLEEALYGWGEEVESNAVEVHIHHIRRKLGVNPIRTVRGVGYLVDKPL